MKIRVLLADDHQLTRVGLRSMLEKDPDFAVVGEAGNGREALRQALQLRPDVVLMDVAMPELNGIEATRQILAAQPGVRVIALSSYTDRRYVSAILRSGARGYLLKSNAYDELRRGVHAVASGKTYLCPEVAGEVVESLRDAPGDGSSAYALLAPREREVLQLIAEGLSSTEIGLRLSVSTSTIETHRRNLMRKLNVHTIAELTKYAIREGLTTLDA
jgi:two-component system NarL family response regulator